MKNIDWDRMDARLMIRQDPQTRDARKRFFKEVDTSRGGGLDAEELKVGIEKLMTEDDGSCLVPMGDELMPAVKCAFNASKHLEKAGKGRKVKKGKAAKVSMKEFHAFLIAFKYYLQLLELFEWIDGQAEDNQKLSLRECRRAIFLLNGWGITEEELEEKFKGVDAWTSHMKFKDFAEWCIDESGCLNRLQLDDSDNEDVVHGKTMHKLHSQHSVELKSEGYGVVPTNNVSNQELVLNLFRQWDVDGSGSITEAEMAAVLTALDPDLTAEQVSMLFSKADHDKDGNLDMNEFLSFILA